jgi:hypothetical protein
VELKVVNVTARRNNLEAIRRRINPEMVDLDLDQARCSHHAPFGSPDRWLSLDDFEDEPLASNPVFNNFSVNLLAFLRQEAQSLGIQQSNLPLQDIGGNGKVETLMYYWQYF